MDLQQSGHTSNTYYSADSCVEEQISILPIEAIAKRRGLSSMVVVAVVITAAVAGCYASHTITTT